MASTETQTVAENLDMIDMSEAPKSPELKLATEQAPDTEPLPEPAKPGLKELHQRQQIESGIKPLYSMRETGQFDNTKIVEMAKDWAERYGANEATLAETLKYFQLAESALVNFPPGEKVEVVCALAELVADGAIDADTLNSLAHKIVRRGASGTMNKVCAYSDKYTAIFVYDELFKDHLGLPQKTAQILQHEIAHGLADFGGVGSDSETSEHTAAMIRDDDPLLDQDTYRTSNAAEQYKAVKKRPESTPEEIEKKQRWLQKEFMAEKIAAYLKSGGEFSGFLNALWDVTPIANKRKIAGSPETKNAWIEKNRFFFVKIDGQMKEKAALKERVITGTAQAREQLEDNIDWDELEFFDDDYGSYSEPAIQDDSKSPNAQPEKDNIWSMLGQLANAAGEEIPIPGGDVKV